jgi:hypothetical protein
MQLGDGSFMKCDSSVYYTSSKVLADQFQQLSLHAGWTSIIHLHYKANESTISINGRPVENAHDIYRCSLIKSKTNPSVNHGHSKIQEIQEEKFIENENIISKIKRIFTFCNKLNKIYNVDDINIISAFKNYSNGNIDIEYNDKMYNICGNCKTLLSIESKTSEYICKKCGTVEKMYGVVFEDEQFFYQEGQRTKHGKYDPTKHCKFWVDRILARENIDDKKFKNAVKSVKACRKRDKIRTEQLTCEMIRSYLKELHLTAYNDHVSLIRKEITRREPTQLTEHEIKLVYAYFCRVIQIFNKIKTINKPNCPYHPYFIYKIIEQILKKPEHNIRKKEILSNIHLQSRETLIDNDNIWSQIVPHISEFDYVPTESR